MQPNLLSLTGFLLGACVTVFAIYTWGHRAPRESRLFSIFMISIAVYVMGYSLELASTSLPLMLFWNKAAFFGIATYPTLFLLFAVQYTGWDRYLTRRNVLLLFLVPAVLTVIKLLDDRLHLVYQDVWVDTSGPVPMLGFTRGQIYPLALYHLLPVSLGIILLWKWRANALTLYRNQANLIIASALPPVIVFLLYMAGIQLFPGLKYLDWNALVFPVWGIIIGRAAFHYRLLDLAPVARDALIERLGDSVFVLDDRARLVDANPEACRMMGWPQPPIGSQADEAFSSWTELAEACQAPEEPLPLKRDIQRGPDGAAHFYDLSLTPLKDRNNGVIGLLIVMHDITDLKRMEARLRELTLVDELTGLHNRRGFNVLAGQALQMADRMSLQAAVIFIDLDGLKTINDNYGHTEGDLALADAARLLRSTCRASDVLARFGGDEFIVLMMESREDGAQQLIDRFDEQFADFNARSRREYPLTISCGVARTSLDRPIPLEELINMADRAMYVNKRARRQAPAEI